MHALPRAPHSLSHELSGSDTVRPSVQNSGTQLGRARTTNYEDGLDAVLNTASKRYDVGLAAGGHGAAKHADASHSIPYTVISTTANPAEFADEDATQRIDLHFTVPADWASGGITIKTAWEMSATGLVDLEHSVRYYAYDVDDAAETVLVAAWTDTPTQPNAAVAPRVDTVTITIAEGDVAASRPFRILFRRNTGDANTGACALVGEDVRATLTQ